MTDAGRQLLDGSRWMSVLVLDELSRLGIPLGKMLIDQQVGGDEMDVLAEISGELAMFELKDKEFSLGNAYSFGAKMGIFRPRHPVIITTEVVGGDAKDHFRRARLGQEQRQSPYELDDFDEDESPSGITYIEGLNNLRSGLEKLVTEIYSRDMQAVLAQAVPQGVLSPAALLRAVRSSTGPDLPEATAKMAVGESLQAGVQPEESGVI